MLLGFTLSVCQGAAMSRFRVLGFVVEISDASCAKA